MEAIAAVAEEVVRRNGLGGAVRIVRAQVESMPDLPEPVDVIVSEWMGYCLLYECMLQSVIAARDRFLKPGGAVLPDRATMHLAGVGAGALDLDYWNDVHGFDMGCVKAAIAQSQRGEALIQRIPAKDVVTGACRFADFDLLTVTAADLEAFEAPFDVRTVLGGRGAGKAPK